jgi:hypothetical protein
MLQKLRDWAKNRSASNAPMTTQQVQDAAQENRESRASYVTDLQAQVRSLQQQITDLAAAPEDGIGSKGPQGIRINWPCSSKSFKRNNGSWPGSRDGYSLRTLPKAQLEPSRTLRAQRCGRSRGECQEHRTFPQTNCGTETTPPTCRSRSLAEHVSSKQIFH